MTGIPITVALKKLSERDQAAERHKFFPKIQSEEQYVAENEEAIIRAIEKDFHAEADQLLDRFQLSYLKPKAKAA